MIVRRWGCRTRPGSEDAYLRFLASVIIPEMRALPGNRGVRVLRRLDGAGAGTTIVVVSYWSDMDSIRAFAGPEPAQAVVPETAQALLQTYDRSVEHFAVEATH